METIFKFVFLILGYLHLRWYEGGVVFLPSNKGCIYVMGLKVSMEWLYQSFIGLDVSYRKSLLIFGLWLDRCLLFECLIVFDAKLYMITLRKSVSWMVQTLMIWRAWKRRKQRLEEIEVDRPQILRWWS